MKKGISLIALLTTVVILIILVSAVSVSGIKTLNDSRKIQFASELAYIQELVNTYKLKNGNYPSGDEYKFSTLSIDSSIINEQFSGETINANNITLYKVSTEVIGANELRYGNSRIPEDIYVVSKFTGRVYYINSLIVDKKPYYTLTNDLKKIINYTDINEVSNPDTIVFDYPTVEWTNVPLDLNIKVPKRFFDVAVNIVRNSGSTAISNNSADDVYNIYGLKNMQENYMVHVSYKENQSDLEFKVKTYSVSNFDKVLPEFDVSEVKTITDNDTLVQYKYISVTNISDDLSGIKSIKYENSKIEEQNIEEYFKNKGIEVKNGSITVNEGVSTITIYTVDKAGNYKFRYVQI